MFYEIQSSIHPSILIRLIRGQTQLADPDFPLTRNIFQLILEDPEAFPGHLGDIIPPACLGSSPGSSQLDVPGKPRKGGVQEASELDARTTLAGFTASAVCVGEPNLIWQVLLLLPHRLWLLPR